MNKLSPPTPPRIPDGANNKWGEIDAKEVLAYDSGTNTYQVSIDRRDESVALDVVPVVATVSYSALWPQDRRANGEYHDGDPAAWNEGENDDG